MPKKNSTRNSVEFIYTIQIIRFLTRVSSNRANIEIDKLRKSTGIELQTLKAELKRAEIKIGSLELNVQQKVNFKIYHF